MAQLVKVIQKASLDSSGWQNRFHILMKGASKSHCTGPQMQGREQLWPFLEMVYHL